MDLDKFKPINDTFGHAEGDRALTVFANQMKAMCRDEDIFARLGGDEFALLLIDASQENAENVVSILRHSVEKYNQEAKRGYGISFAWHCRVTPRSTTRSMPWWRMETHSCTNLKDQKDRQQWVYGPFTLFAQQPVVRAEKGQIYFPTTAISMRIYCTILRPTRTRNKVSALTYVGALE